MWSTAIGIGIVALGATILMPSTKSGRAIHYHEEDAPTTMPTTQETQPVPKGYRRVVMPGSKSDRINLVPDETQSVSPPATQSTSQAK